MPHMPQAAPAPSILKVLLIEDSEDDVMLFRRELRKGGLDAELRIVDSVAALEESLDSAEWDIIVSDFRLTGLTGLAALDVVRRRRIDIPFILVSDAVGESMAVKAMKAGAADYLMKSNLSRLVPVMTREVSEMRNRREAIRQREAVESQLMQSQKLEAVGTLAGGITHDFNNLLQVIRGNAEILSITGSVHDSGRENIDEILEACTRAEQLVRQLLVFTRKKLVLKAATQIVDIVDGVVAMLRRLIDEHISIEVIHDDSNMPLVWADAASLEQVILNLATNARDAMPEGGRLLISTRPITLNDGEPAPFAHPLGRNGEFIQIQVSDEGTGISPEVLASMFDPFFTTKPEGQGTGLGLSMVYGIVDDHDGWLEVNSTLGTGTVFTIWLPVDGTHPVPLLESGGHPELRSPPSRILIVEDKQALRAFLVEALAGDGHDIVVAASCAEARAATVRGLQAFDMVICDVFLPDGSGINLITALIRQFSGLSVLLTSGDVGDQLSIVDFYDTPVRVLPKPVGPCDLLRTTQIALGRSPAASRS